MSWHSWSFLGWLPKFKVSSPRKTFKAACKRRSLRLAESDQTFSSNLNWHAWLIPLVHHHNIIFFFFLNQSHSCWARVSVFGLKATKIQWVEELYVAFDKSKQTKRIIFNSFKTEYKKVTTVYDYLRRHGNKFY